MTSSSSSIAKCKSPPGKKRVEQVFKWILIGATEQDVQEAIRQAWPKAKSTPLIVAAIERLKAAGDFDPQILDGWCIEASREMYRRMVEIHDYPGALRAVKQLAELSRRKSS